MLFPVNSFSPLFHENSLFFFMFLFKAILGLTALIVKIHVLMYIRYTN